MVDVVTWENAHLHGSALVSHHRLRYRVFVERQHYDVPSYHGMEYDQYDTPAAVYLLPRGRDGRVCGTTRLIPTTRPYMIKQLWPDLVQGHDLPSAPEVWEATRFGVEPNLSPTERNRVTGEIVLACLEFGLMQGIRRYLVLMPVPIISRVIGGAGCTYAYLGEPRTLGRHRVAVASVDVSAEILREARRRLNAPEPVLNYHQDWTEEEAA